MALVLAQTPAAQARDSSTARLISLYDSSKDADTRETIVRYLADHTDDAAITKLVAIAKSHDDDDVRERAIRSLAQDSSAARTKLLIELYDGLDSSDLKELAIRCIAGRDAEGNAKVIAVAKSEKEDDDARERAIRLTAQRSNATPLLIDLYDAIRNTDLRELVIRELGAAGDEKAIAKLEAIVKGETDSDLRDAAVRLLAKR